MIATVFKNLTIGIILFFLLTSPGCDNTFDPVNEEKGLYSIYGYLDLYKDVNYIRVKDLNKSLLQDTSSTIDAEVTFKNLDTGTSQTLQDSIVEFDGVKTHNFRTTMDIQSDTRYRVTVERSDGRKMTATATAPPIAETNVTPAFPNCTTQVDISFDPAEGVNALDLEVGFHYDSEIFWARSNKFLKDQDGQVVAIFTPKNILDEVFGGVNPSIPIEGANLYCHQLDHGTFHIRYTHFGPDLFENTISDTLKIPGGAGRFGALYRDSFTFEVDTTKLCPPLPLDECPAQDPPG
jgi:hypothetical protein